MPPGSSSDLVMMFVPNTGGDPVPAESRTNLLADGPSPNPLLKGFKRGFMFEIDKFTFQAGGDAGKADNGKENAKGKKPLLSNGGERQGLRAGNAQKFPVDLQPVSFTRDIDRASSRLLQNCIDCISYDSVTLIKRKPIGNAAAGEAFLRFDFVGVLVISMSWSNDDEVSETCEFICRSVTISYRPQLPDGSLGAIVPGFWSMVPGDVPVTV